MFNIIINQQHYLTNKGFFNNTILVSEIPWYDPVFYLICIFYINIILWFRGVMTDTIYHRHLESSI